MKTDAIIILDGYGLDGKTEGNAIKKANTPYLDSLFASCPHSTLSASGKDVGLPALQMGNSEVGHLNIGAGRVVFQDITAIDNEIETGEFFRNPALVQAMENAKDKALHIAGLCSDGGVHSSLLHLFALIKMAAQMGVKNVYIHAITDGRDTPPKSAERYIAEIERVCKEEGTGKIATVLGRYFFMDRDNRWERVEKGYNCVFNAKGLAATSAKNAMENAYLRGETDEFVLPTALGDYKGINPFDSFIFFNFRSDRAREISRAATEKDFVHFERGEYKHLFYVGFTLYDKELTGVVTAFEPKNIPNTLGEYLSSCGKTQLRIAETEKYAHVTFFFNGGVEKPSEGEERILIPSPKVATYDLLPQMSAMEVAERAAQNVGKKDVLILNFANCDMVGHTGNFDAAVKAVEAVDAALKIVVESVLKSGGFAIVTADHGNAESMTFSDGSPMTAHTTCPVPFILVGRGEKEIKNGILADIAPTFLKLMGMEIPKEMTGQPLC
jgi:2,3-bisphosphoglycerate-independent phosphoglycerate mutase